MSYLNAVPRRNDDALALAPLFDRDRFVKAARLLTLIAAHDEYSDGSLTYERLAYFDFLLYSPRSLARVLESRHRSARAVELRDDESESIEARLASLRIEPWRADLRRRAASLLAAKLITVEFLRGGDALENEWTVRPTERGREVLIALGDPFANDRRRARIILETLNMKLRGLRNAVGLAIPESITLQEAAL